MVEKPRKSLASFSAEDLIAAELLLNNAEGVESVKRQNIDAIVGLLKLKKELKIELNRDLLKSVLEGMENSEDSALQIEALKTRIKLQELKIQRLEESNKVHEGFFENMDMIGFEMQVFVDEEELRSGDKEKIEGVIKKVQEADLDDLDEVIKWATMSLGTMTTKDGESIFSMTITRANKKAEELFSHTREGVIGNISLSDIVNNESQEESIKKLLELFNWGRRGPDAYTMSAFGSSPIQVEAHSHIAVDRYPYVEQGVLNDVTMKNRIEEIRHLMEGDASTHILEATAGGIAHNLNNNLASVVSTLSYLQELLDEGSISEDDAVEALEAVKDALSSTNDASSTIQALLDSSAQGVYRTEVIDLPDTTRVNEKVYNFATRPGVKLNIEIDENVDKIFVDPNKIKRAIINLINNADQSMPNGGEVTLSMRNANSEEEALLERKGMVRIAVSDTGSGISKEDREKVFEPFYTTKDKAKGLGLSTVLGIVRKSDGIVDIDSEPGVGTTVLIYLPSHDYEAEQNHETLIKEIKAK